MRASETGVDDCCPFYAADVLRANAPYVRPPCFSLPQVSLLQWHPFSVSSSPYDSHSTFHIKADGNFTEALHAYVKDAEAKFAANKGPNPTEALTLSIDGPYGLPIRHQQYKNVILFAGGIGVTPIHSTFRSLYHAAERGECSCESVHLAWTARYTDIFLVGKDILLKALANPNPGGAGTTTFTFECVVNDPMHTHDTTPYVSSNEVPYTISGGYMNTGAIIDAIVTPPSTTAPGSVQAKLARDGAETLVFVCGPPGLSGAAEGAAFDRSLDFHAESFAL